MTQFNVTREHRAMRFACASRHENTRCNETTQLLYKEGKLYASHPCMGISRKVEDPDGVEPNGSAFYVDPVFLNNLKATKNTPAIVIREPRWPEEETCLDGSIRSCHTDEGKPFTVRADEPFNQQEWDVEQLNTHLETGDRGHHFTVSLALLRRLLKSMGPCDEDTKLEFYYDDSVKPVQGPLKKKEHIKAGVLIKVIGPGDHGEVQAEAVVMPIIREKK